MGYEIQKNCDATAGKIKNVSVEEYGSIKYLNIELQYDNGCVQGYPACKLNSLEEGIQYFNERFDVNKLEDAIGKRIWAIGGFASIFALINQENYKIFSLNAQFFPEQYDESVNKLKSQEEFKYLDGLNKHDTLLIATIAHMNPKSELSEDMKKVMNSYLLNKVLNEQLEEKATKHKQKI